MATTKRRLDRSAFLRELKETFSELRGTVNKEYGLLHPEVHAVREFAQAAIERDDAVVVAKCFQLAERFLVHGNGNMSNAIGVSFVEHLRFSPERAWAWKALPSSLKGAYEALCGKQAI